VRARSDGNVRINLRMKIDISCDKATPHLAAEGLKTRRENMQNSSSAHIKHKRNRSIAARRFSGISAAQQK